MISRRPPRRLAAAAGAVGLLGSCAVLVVLLESPGSAGPVRQVTSAAPGAADQHHLSAAAQTAQTARSRLGLRLMTQAAAACQTIAFRGIQLAAWWGPAGGNSSRIQVWHRAGGDLLAQPASGTGDAPAESQPDAAAMPDQDEVMSVSPQLLSLMRETYLLTYSGRGAVDGRAARVVDVTRPGGQLAARFWLDAATGLPLRRELFDSSARVFSEDTFTSLSIGAGRLGSMPASGAQPWTGQLSAARLAALRAQGWPLPRSTAGGLTMFRADETETTTGTVMELSYSDGLSVISVFVQRGELPRRLPGWRRVAAPGGQVYASDPDDRSLAWSAHGFVYTMIADATTATVDRAVLAMPQDRPPAFWARIGRGLRRISSWANPFR